MINIAGLAEVAICEERYDLATRLAGYIRRHYKPTCNTIFSLQRIDPEALAGQVSNAKPELESLLEGSQLSQREAIRLAMQV